MLRGISASGQQRAKGRRDEKGLHERGRHRFLAPLFKFIFFAAGVPADQPVGEHLALFGTNQQLLEPQRPALQTRAPPSACAPPDARPLRRTNAFGAQCHPI